jgi:signal peptidase I
MPPVTLFEPFENSMRPACGAREPRVSPLRIAALLGTVLVLLCFCAGAILCFQLYSVGSDSMADTVRAGDRILVEKISARLGREPKFGDIVVHRYPPNRVETFIKRIVGVPGDRLRIVNKQLYRNGTPVAEQYVKHMTSYVDSYRDNFPSTLNLKMPLLPRATEMLQEHVQAGEVVVPQGKYFVLGDNRDDSLDSRYWGFISKSDVIGRPLLVYLSIEKDSREPPPVAKIRWERFLKHL